MKEDKAAGIDGCEVEFVKRGGAAVEKWLVWLFNLCFMSGVVPADWRDACVVPLYKGKGDRLVCGNSRGISLSVIGKLYGKVLITRIREKTEGVLGEEQCGLGKREDVWIRYSQ